MCKNTNSNVDDAPSVTPVVQGIPIVFNNLEYSVAVGGKNDEPVKILLHLSGAFLPGRLTALMGPSGSGKSTLLDCLSGRKTTNVVVDTGGSNDNCNAPGFKGEILYGDRTPTTLDFRRSVGYVEQFDTLVGELTVEQMLHYTAELKLPATISKEERTARVEEVLAMLDLTSCRSTVIGSSLMRGISGGQAKRVNIGLALITSPPVLFLDEPTSGLDSRTANEVVMLLQRLAHEGRTVVCTIHSPSGHAFAQFDDLYMIVQGETVFDGPLPKVQEYFEALGHVRDAESSMPEWLVDLTSGMQDMVVDNSHEGGSKENPKSFLPSETELTSGSEVNDPATQGHRKQLDRRGSSFAETFASSKFMEETRQQRRKTLQKMSEDANPHVAHPPPSNWTKLWALLKYRTVAHYKDGEFLGVRFGEKIVYALLIFSLYWGIGDNMDQQSIASTASLLFLIATLCGFGAAAFVPVLNLERKLFYRELADGCYTPVVYFANKFIEEAFIALFTSAIFCVMVYYGCALTGSFGILFITYYLTTMIGIALAYFFAAAVNSLDAANTLLPLYVTMCLFFGGLFIVFDKIPVYWEWFSWTVFLRYAWGALMVDNYADSAAGQALVFVDDAGNPITVLEFYGMSNGPIMNSIGACFGMLSGLLVIFAGLCLAALIYIRHEKR